MTWSFWLEWFDWWPWFFGWRRVSSMDVMDAHIWRLLYTFYVGPFTFCLEGCADTRTKGPEYHTRKLGKKR